MRKAGLGAYSGSANKTELIYPTHFQNYFDGGDDVWVYDLAIRQWAWIAGSSNAFKAPLSTAPGSDVQTPGFFL
jgi:hypothetical protein